MKGRVVHCKKEKYDVYIGRPGNWGNPFSMKDEGDRDLVIERYRAWLDKMIESGGINKDAIISLRGKTLGCWCAPKPCHGDVLLEVAERLYQESSPS